MAEKSEHHEESLLEKITEKFHGGDSSSSDSEDEKEKKKEKEKEKEKEKNSESPSSSSSLKDKFFRLFGREKPVHTVLGGGKPADVFLWRNKKVSAGVLGTATAIWVLFELVEYHFLTLVCHLLILTIALLFLWANATRFVNKSTPPRIPEVKIPEDLAVQVASAFRVEINRGFAILREIASGRDLKKFLSVIAGLWVVSIVGNWCNFLTLVYIAFVLLHTVPVFYEKYDDKVDAYAEKAWIEIKKQYAVFDAKVLSKVLSKIPRGPLKKD